MNKKRIIFIFVAIGVLLVTGSIFLLAATPVSAQCGSQASSCKNCHETQGQKPVNNDGTAWHTSHAFGDFCYLCHAGNNQATDKVAAHTGMVAPLSDIAASCKSCHANDYQAKAQIYATTLGVTIGSGGTVPTVAAGQPAAPTTAAATVAPAAAQAAVVPVADMVNYSQRYDEIALGKTPVNVGNIIVIVLIAIILLGGGFFVARREGWIKVAFDNPKHVPVKEKYPVDVVEMLPVISRLKSPSRQILRNILAKPEVASDLLASIDKLTHDESAGDQSSEDQKE